MNHDQFAYWLQGFVETNGGKEPTKEQWKIIKDHLQLCFVKGGTMIPQGQYRYPEYMKQWLTPVIGGGMGGGCVINPDGSYQGAGGGGKPQGGGGGC
jgi:hypothetical protein